MKKNYPNKMMGEAPVSKLICRRECMVPGFGTYTPGQPVEDPNLIAYIQTHITAAGEHPDFTVADSQED